MKKVTVIRDQILLETTVPFLGKIWRVLGLGTYRTECVVQSDSRQQLQTHSVVILSVFNTKSS